MRGTRAAGAPTWGPGGRGRCAGGETEKQGGPGAGRGPGLPAAEAGSAARPRPCVVRDELVLQKPAGPSLESSHPVFSLLGPGEMLPPPLAGGGPPPPFHPRLLPSSDRRPPRRKPGHSPPSPGLHPCVLCPSQARPGPPLIASLTGPWKKESLGKPQPWVRIAAPSLGPLSDLEPGATFWASVSLFVQLAPA